MKKDNEFYLKKNYSMYRNRIKEFIYDSFSPVDIYPTNSEFEEIVDDFLHYYLCDEEFSEFSNYFDLGNAFVLYEMERYDTKMDEIRNKYIELQEIEEKKKKSENKS